VSIRPFTANFPLPLGIGGLSQPYGASGSWIPILLFCLPRIWYLVTYVIRYSAQCCGWIYCLVRSFSLIIVLRSIAISQSYIAEVPTFLGQGLQCINFSAPEGLRQNYDLNFW